MRVLDRLFVNSSKGPNIFIFSCFLTIFPIFQIPMSAYKARKFLPLLQYDQSIVIFCSVNISSWCSVAEEILHSGLALTIRINILDSVLSSVVIFNFNLAKYHSLSYSITIHTQVEYNLPFTL